MKSFNKVCLMMLLAAASSSLFAESSSMSEQALKEIQNECELEAKDYDLKGEEKDEFVASCVRDLSPEDDSEDSSDEMSESESQTEE